MLSTQALISSYNSVLCQICLVFELPEVYAAWWLRQTTGE